MYHTHRAIEIHDEVFALLGMSSDDLNAARFLHNYKISWEERFRQLIEFLLGGQVFVKTWTHPEMTVIDGKGYILGKVSAEGDPDRDDRKQVVFRSKDASRHMGPEKKWVLQAWAKPIQVGDLVCSIQGASKPMVIRTCKDHFSVIMITVAALEMDSGSIGQPEQPITSSPRDFLLLWHRERFSGNLQDQEYEMMIESRLPEHSCEELRGYSDKMTRLWNVGLILEDAEQYQEAGVRLQEAVNGYEMEFGKGSLLTLTSMGKLALLCKEMDLLAKAKKLLKLVIQGRREVQGADHPDSITSTKNLAMVYRRMNQLKEAEKLEAMTCILQGKRDHAKIIEEELSTIAMLRDEEVMKLLLDSRGSDVQITESVVTAAARNYWDGYKVMQLLLDRRGDVVQITEGQITEA